MRPEQDRVVRIGVWIVTAAAIACLIVLALSAAARADEPLPSSRLGALLLDRTPITPGERLDAAQTLLRERGSHRRMRLYGQVLDTGWRAWQGASPQRLLRSAGNVVEELWSWRDRDRTEDVVLDLLELAIDETPAGSPAFELYSDLRSREIESRARRKLDAADAALEAGHIVLARVRLGRAVAMVPESARASDLAERLARGSADASPRPDLQRTSWIGPRDWEPGLASALLSEDYEGIETAGNEAPEAALVRAAARCARGAVAQARRDLRRLARYEGHVGQLARDWLELPTFEARDRFHSAQRGYRLRTALGWLGGSSLADDGLEISSRGYKAWRRSMAPLNLALSVPARIYQGWRPDGNELRERAVRYIEAEPEGESRARAKSWLANLGPAPVSALARALESGQLELPAPRTAHLPLAPGPLVLTRAAVESGHIPRYPALLAALADAEAIILRPGRDAIDAPMLSGDEAVELLGALVSAAEGGRLQPTGSSLGSSLARLHRLHRAVESGFALFASPWLTDQGPLDRPTWAVASLVGDAMLEGAARSLAGARITRGGDDLRVDRGFGNVGFACPVGAVCIHRSLPVRGSVYGRAEVDASMHVGARAEFHQASLTVELHTTGPRASLYLPIARWVGLERWIPLAARVDIGMDSVYLGPVLTVRNRQARIDRRLRAAASLQDVSQHFD